jgi:hypothetical protein
MAYVYRHIRLDKNEPFYIGIGSDSNFQRAYDKTSRNKHWNHISAKGYYVEILINDLTWDAACVKEKEFIALYGRNDLGLGSLCNMTDGGEGAINRIFSKEHRERISKSKMGHKVSEETLNKLRTSRIGIKHTEEFKQNMSLRNSGKNNPNFGKVTPEYIKEMKRRIILDTNTGIYYDSLLQASSLLNIANGNLSKMLNGKRNNKTGLKYV